MTPAELFKQLVPIPESVWCEYLFDQDPLKDKVSPERRAELIAGGVACGEKIAKQLKEENGTKDATALAEKLCVITHTDADAILHQVFLATFTEPNQLKLFDTPITKLADLQVPGFTRDVILNIVTGHELFHYAEGKYDDLYTKTAKVDLWQLFGYHHQSTVRAVSEIAAMAFSWRLNKLTYSPLVLNILLLSQYAKTGAEPALAQLQQLTVQETA
ncbi:hypothetical protein [Lacticaseibacillus camelliae]|uniref:Uncharacterized protein n=1 Tax=Lacticaseibacillus camelliae DSM 22697 = JCM 13995 TaxID=1423730 RepID=A0A0R2ESE7_9LACO|nr:hypothetical protein [Lacticaseibacillus camelliae]KRN19121.1 hypothetical protein FC75_GL000220 [Lacticaseibacillus camelliae DSM 22697 = JCM 13995]